MQSEVVVVGAGVVGASVAFHLRRLGVGKVTLVERRARGVRCDRPVGCALVRTHYTNDPEASLAIAALPWFTEWADRVGGDCGFVRTGFVQLVGVDDTKLLRENVKSLQRLGATTETLAASDIRAVVPGLAVADDESAAYEPESGYADPVATTRGLVDAARRLGADVRENCSVDGLLTAGGHVVGVATNDGPINAEVVVLANGAWSNALTRPLGLDLPITATRAQAAVVRRPAPLVGIAGHPAVIDRRNGIYARPYDADRTLVGMSSSNADTLSDLDDVPVAPGFAERARDRLAEAFPAFSGQPISHTQAGPLDVTPDHCAILGPVDGIDGLVLAVGMSGSGFKKAPAIGACLAELIQDGQATSADLRPFSYHRFARGAQIERRDYRMGAGGGTALVH